MTDYTTLLEMWRNEKKKRQDAEGELSIIKAIGSNSPEVKTLQARIKEMDNSLSIALDINDQYQRENKKLKEKLSKTTEEYKYDLKVYQEEIKNLSKNK
jgi:regulator of replication initiation timing